MAEILFDEAAHVYTVGGRRLPSVTQILAEVGLIDDAWFTSESRERGRIVHLLTALADRGELDEETVDPRLAGYLEAWLLWKQRTGTFVNAVEQRVHSAIYGYCGTLDRTTIGETLVDIKSGAPERWHALQTAAYAQALRETTGTRVRHRLAVYLAEDGTYTTKPHNERTDFETFAAAARLAAWRRNGK